MDTSNNAKSLQSDPNPGQFDKWNSRLFHDFSRLNLSFSRYFGGWNAYGSAILTSGGWGVSPHPQRYINNLSFLYLYAFLWNLAVKQLALLAINHFWDKCKFFEIFRKCYAISFTMHVMSKFCLFCFVFLNFICMLVILNYKENMIAPVISLYNIL